MSSGVFHVRRIFPSISSKWVYSLKMHENNALIGNYFDSYVFISTICRVNVNLIVVQVYYVLTYQQTEKSYQKKFDIKLFSMNPTRTWTHFAPIKLRTWTHCKTEPIAHLNPLRTWTHCKPRPTAHLNPVHTSTNCVREYTAHLKPRRIKIYSVPEPNTYPNPLRT